MEELANEQLEHAEHAERAMHAGDNFMIRVSATIAVLAVLAAVVASLETVETGHAISEKNDAVLMQAQASDEWAYYQAKSIKQNLYAIAAGTNAEHAADYLKQAARYEAQTREIQKKAQELEHKRDEKLAASNKHEEKHHGLTFAATLVHIGIAVATIAIITKGQKWPWYVAIALGVVGAGKAAVSYLA